MQGIYDIDEESFKSVEEGEGSLDLCFTPLQLISNGFQMDGGQQRFISDDEEENKGEILEEDVNNEFSLEKEEAMEEDPAQEYMDLFTEPCTSEQNISELQEDNTAIYDESSSSEDEGDSLERESLLLDPVEEEEILVEASLPNIHS